MPFKRLQIFVIFLILVACGSTPPPVTNPTVELTSTFGRVEEIRLSDGTLCAVVRSGTGSGIDCDWGER